MNGKLESYTENMVKEQIYNNEATTIIYEDNYVVAALLGTNVPPHCPPKECEECPAKTKTRCRGDEYKFVLMTALGLDLGGVPVEELVDGEPDAKFRTMLLERATKTSEIFRMLEKDFSPADIKEILHPPYLRGNMEHRNPKDYKKWLTEFETKAAAETSHPQKLMLLAFVLKMFH